MVGMSDTLERYRTALRSIANNTCCRSCQEAARVAKAALIEDWWTRLGVPRDCTIAGAEMAHRLLASTIGLGTPQPDKVRAELDAALLAAYRARASTERPEGTPPLSSLSK